MFIVSFYLFHIFKGVANSDIRFFPARSMRWSGMDKIKSRIKTNSDKQYTLSILRNTIFGKIVQLHFHHVARTNFAEILDNLLNRAPIVRC